MCHLVNSGGVLQEQIDQIVEDKILQALCGPDASGEAVRVGPLSHVSYNMHLQTQYIEPCSTAQLMMIVITACPHCKCLYDSPHACLELHMHVQL